MVSIQPLIVVRAQWPVLPHWSGEFVKVLLPEDHEPAAVARDGYWRLALHGTRSALSHYKFVEDASCVIGKF
jgi:hypothetical protein